MCVCTRARGWSRRPGALLSTRTRTHCKRTRCTRTRCIDFVQYVEFGLLSIPFGAMLLVLGTEREESGALRSRY